MIGLLTLALAGEVVLEEPVVARDPIHVGSTTYTASEPVFLVPTPTFDRLLIDTKKLRACEGGLERTEAALLRARTEQEAASTVTTEALLAAGAALQTAQEQMGLDQRNDQEQLALILKLQNDVGKARGQRNVALGVAAGVAVVVAAGFISQ